MIFRMKNLFALTVSCLFAALPLKAAVIEADFSKGSNLRLLNGAELKDGILFIKGGKSCAEVAGTEKIKLGKSGLTVSCVAAFDKLPAWGQDLFWKKESWMLSRFDRGAMTAYLHSGKMYISRTDGGKPAEPGSWNHYSLVIKPIVQVEEGKYGYIIEVYINGELEARTENFDYTLNEPDVPVTLGRGAAGDVWAMQGKIAFFRIEDRALAQEELFKEASSCKLVKISSESNHPITPALKSAMDKLPAAFPERKWLISSVRRAAANGADQALLAAALKKAENISAATLEEAAVKFNSIQDCIYIMTGKRAALCYILKNSNSAFPLAGMLDRKSGREIFGKKSMNFRLKTLAGKKRSGYTANESKWNKTVEISRNSAVLTFKNHAATVTITQKFDGNARLESHIKAVMTDPKQLLQEVVFPDNTFARLDGGNDKMLYPYMEGVIVNNPTVATHPRVRQDMFYPRSYLSMQFGAYYDNKSGIYFAFEDPDAEVKQYYAQGRKGEIAAYWTGFAPWKVGSTGGNSYDMSGVSAIELYDGEWYEAAKVYRKFLESKAKWWIKELPRKDTAKWFRDLPGWVQVHYSHWAYKKAPEIIAAEMKAFRDYLELPYGIHLYGWSDAKKNSWPHFYPFDSIKAFLKDIGEKSDIYVKPYIDSRLWAVKDGGANEYDYMFTSHGKKFAVKNPDGTMNYEHYSSMTKQKSIKHPYAIMCPGAVGWQNFMVEMSTRVLGYGFTSLYHDEIAAARPYNCYDPEHDHLVNDPKAWVAGHRKFMSEIRRKNPGTGHDCEDGAEAFIDMMDGLMIWRWYGLDPVFMAIYHGRIQFTGRQFNYGFISPKYYRQFFPKIAVQLAAAEQLGWFQLVNMSLDDQRLFFKKACHVRNMLLEYFNEGEMLAPVKFITHPGTARCDWGNRHRDGGPEVTTDRIITGIFSRNDSVTVVIMVNPYAEKASFELDLKRYGKQIIGVYGEKGKLSSGKMTLDGESFAVMVMADKVTPEAEKEASRIEKYMLRIGKFSAGLSPQDTVKLANNISKESFDPEKSVPFGMATTVINANRAADCSFIGWMRENTVVSFNPVKAVSGSFKCKVKVSQICGTGKIIMTQGGRVLAEFAVSPEKTELVSSESFTLEQGVPVCFSIYGKWQGRMLDWQLIK
ncbi:MAG: LamG domain-containing protein [Lentisphaerae bacterium]|nr:LamG domain-containing protein [Lentisphaerota bacterium]